MIRKAMPKKIGLVAAAVVIVLMGAQLIYANLRLHWQSSTNAALNAMMGELRAQVSELDTALKQKEDILDQLSDAQAIRAALSSAQAMVEKLNRSLQLAADEKAALQAANLNLDHRLATTTREFTQAMDDLKQAKVKLASLEKSGVDAAKAVASVRSVAAEAPLSQLKQELLRVRQERQVLADDNAFLERKMREMEAQKARLDVQLGALQREVSGQGQPLEQLQQTIRKLSAEVSDKEMKLRALDSQLQDAASSQGKGGDLARLYESAQVQLREYAETIRLREKALDEVKEERAELERQLSVAAEGGTSGASETALRLQKENRALQETIAGLEARIAALNAQLSSGDDGRLKGLEDERTILTYRLKEAQEALAKKTELAESLQTTVDSLRERLARKNEEQEAIEQKIGELEAMTAQLQAEQAKNRALSDERDAQYTGLRAQITELSDALTRKELELRERRMEMVTLKNDIAGLKVRSSTLEENLASTRERQRRTLDDLSQAVRLNASLQERIVELSQEPGAPKTGMDVFGEGDATKARELKKRIEVILEPEG